MMKPVKYATRLSVAISCLITCGMVLTSKLFAQPVKATQVGSRIDVTIGDAFFTSYRFSKDEKYPFLFPVNGPSGASVTSMRNGQYPHHSSLFFGCDMVNGGNYWQEGLERGQILSSGPQIVRASGDEVVITDTCDWKRAGAAQPLRDSRRIAIRAPSKDLREIDFDITLTALEDVEILKTNHSLFSARMDPDLTPQYGGTLVNAEGLTGEKDTFGKSSPWLACYGPRGDSQEGLAILQHPENPNGPSPWFTRNYGFLSPTPMFWPSDGKATKMKQGMSLRLRYRVLVFAGTLQSIDIAARHAEFVKAAD